MPPRTTSNPEQKIPIPTSIPKQPTGDTDGSLRAGARRRWPSIVITFLVALALLISVIQSCRGNGIPLNVTGQANQSNTRQYELIEGDEGVVVLIERSGDESTVQVQLDGEIGWRNLSKTYPSASQPSLSPRRDHVAFLVDKTNPFIVISAITATDQFTISATALTSLRPTTSTTASPVAPIICPTTALRWSPNQTRMAFFICDRNSPLSLLGVVQLATPITLLRFDHEDRQQLARSIQWLNNKRLMLSTEGTGGNAGAVEYIDIP